MHFTDAVGSAFRRAGDFRGLSTRSEYWNFFLLNFMIQISATALDFAGTYPFFTLLAAIWSLVALVPGLSIFIRRLRDGGYSPWMSLFVLAGPLGAIVFLVLLCQPSNVSAENDRPAVARSGMHDRPDMPEDKVKPRASSLLLGVSAVATLAIVLGSVTFALVQESNLDAEARAKASQVATVASSQAAASASAEAIADANRQAAAAEANRQAIIVQDEQRAEESRRAMASQAAASATAQADEAARDQLLADGWSDGPDGVFYQWVPAGQVTCQYQRCVQLKVTTVSGCPTGVAVEASELTKGTVTGTVSAVSPGFMTGQNALVTLIANDANGDNVSIKKMTCR